MGKYILRRILQLIPIMLGLSFMVFLLLYIAPGDPALRKLSAQGVAVSEEVLERERESMGLDRPFISRYADWLLNLLHGDMGNSYIDEEPVTDKLLKAMGYTFALSGISLIIALIFSLPLGIWTAIRREGAADNIVRLFSFISNAMPNFLISVLLMYVFCIKLKIFPVIAKGDFKGLLLPAISLALPVAGRFTRQIRAEVLVELGKPYVEGLRYRGLKSRYIIFSNVLRNSMGAILTITGLSLGVLLGGSVVTEVIFSWPGVGSLVMHAISARDYPVVQGFVMLMAVFYVLINLITDISYHMLDPRIELK